MGLAILDSFVFETPVVTTKYDFHGPEFEYLVDGYNGNCWRSYLTANQNIRNIPLK